MMKTTLIVLFLSAGCAIAAPAATNVTAVTTPAQARTGRNLLFVSGSGALWTLSDDDYRLETSAGIVWWGSKAQWQARNVSGKDTPSPRDVGQFKGKHFYFSQPMSAPTTGGPTIR